MFLDIRRTQRLSAVALAAFSISTLAACGEDGVGVLLPMPVLEPGAVDFGNVQVGTEKEVIVLLKNEGAGLLTVESVSAGQPFDEELFSFSIDSMQIPASGVAQIKVTYAPKVLGETTANIVLRYGNADPEEATLSIKGVGVTTALIADPNVLAFGNVVVDTTKTIPVTLRNDSEEDGTVSFGTLSNVQPCGAGGTEVFCYRLAGIQVGPDGTFELTAGQTVTMEVGFTPNIAGMRERGTLTLSACGEDVCNVDITMDGIGVESGFRCDPSKLDFGAVNPGSCVTRTVTCENIANERVTVVAWGPKAGSSPNFQIEASRVQNLTEGQSFDVDGTYCPSSAGEDIGVLEIETSGTPRFVEVELAGSGGGPDIEIVPPAINFGLVSLIAPSRRSVIILNTGMEPLEISEILPDLDGTGTITVLNGGATTIAPGASETITVEFQPVVVGPVETEMLIRSNDSDEPEVRVRLIGEGINLPPCSFELAPTMLSFGSVEINRTQGRAFEIRNIGSNDCLVTSTRLEPGTDTEFSLPDGDVLSEIIPAGSALGIRVDFSPEAAGAYSGAVEFSISDPNRPFNRVPLAGVGAESALLVVPNELNFGVIGIGCASRARTVQLYNTGSVPAIIDSVGLANGTNPGFSITSLPSPLPTASLSIAPGASAEFSVGFRADLQSDYTGAVEIIGSFNGAPATYVVSMTGRGDVDATQEDFFEQLGQPKVDILFVIDDSGSMGQEQAGLSSNFQAFIQFAQAQALDYQLAVTTTDNGEGQMPEEGRFVPLTGNPSDRIVTPSSQPSPEELFAQNANVGIDTTGTEEGMEAAYDALTAPHINGHNAGFLRRDAVLSIIFVSDEPDFSGQSLDFYVNFFLSIKGFRNTNLFSASAIVGDVPGGCNGPGGNATAAPRYVEAANRTGGIFQSICTADWSRSLEQLSQSAFGFKSRFFLTNQPVVSTIRVEVDGVEIAETAPGGTVNWSYDFATNSVNFTPFAVPEPGAEIFIRYTAECL